MLEAEVPKNQKLAAARHIVRPNYNEAIHFSISQFKTRQISFQLNSQDNLLRMSADLEQEFHMSADANLVLRIVSQLAVPDSQRPLPDVCALEKTVVPLNETRDVASLSYLDEH